MRAAELHDAAERGRWGGQRRLVQLIATLAEDAHTHRLAERMEACGRLIGVAGAADGSGALVRQSCDSQQCPRPQCVRHRTRTTRERLRNLLREARHGGQRVRLVTLTLPHDRDTWPDPRSALRDLDRAYSRLRRPTTRLGRLCSFWDSYIAGAYARRELEDGDNGYHPHVHLVCVGPRFIPVPRLRAAWSEAVGDPRATVVDVRAVRLGDLARAVGEVTKYVTKSCTPKHRPGTAVAVAKGTRHYTWARWYGSWYGRRFEPQPDPGLASAEPEAWAREVTRRRGDADQDVLAVRVAGRARELRETWQTAERRLLYCRASGELGRGVNAGDAVRRVMALAALPIMRAVVVWRLHPQLDDGWAPAVYANACDEARREARRSARRGDADACAAAARASVQVGPLPF